MPKPVYPDILKTGNWEKQKGVVAKLAKVEPDPGGACRNAEAAFGKINWGKMDGTAATKLPSAPAINEYIKSMKTEYVTTIEPARKALFDLNSVLAKTANAFKASAIIPKASREHVEKMAAIASQFATTLKSCCEPDLKAAQTAATQKANITFEQCQANQNLWNAFHKFCISEHSDENIRFLEVTKSKPTGGAAQKVYDAFISNKSSMQVNLTSATFAIFHKANTEKKLDGAPWDTARGEILRMLKADTFTRFKTNIAKFL
ncbi:MAG TPA: regulator of G-protein signaling domain-containing protein [Phycisphaerae bacterium]|nr:regulator of G-protein signaling domain-containing protein [Phycisphaerae bacterium]